jgi:maltooligosyltrehalose trehalohydrolase
VIGATVDDGGTRFRVWAPRPRTIELELDGRRLALAPSGDGYFERYVPGAAAGARYAFVLDGERRRPDPASRAQPDGVHGPSQIVDPRAFAWRAAHLARGARRALADYIIYELHVGTFTPDGTFDAAARELPRLAELGVTAVELMPVAAFPGRRNWGYDGVAWLAPQASYGGPDGLRRFVDAAHARGLSVVLDVVYNHLGPEGNYLGEFGPYFTPRHRTPWGDALDYAAPAVRAHVLASARCWLDEYRVDALRLDAVHAIADDSPRHIVADVAAACRDAGALAIAESDLGDACVIEPRGWACDAQWADDLHHALHAALTGERAGYYGDFAGGAADVARAIEHGFVYTGQPSRFRGRPHGTPVKHLPAEQLVVCAQNHDQIGNRARGERLAQLAPGCEFAAAAVVLLAPGVPLLFMGEEHADPAPFLYFTDHQDAALARAVTEGRRREHAYAGGDVPDPQAAATFERSRIDRTLDERGRHAEVRRFYRALLGLRRERPSLRALDRTRCEARAQVGDGDVLTIRRWSDADETFAAINLSPREARVFAPAPRRAPWRTLFAAHAAHAISVAGDVRIRTQAIEIILPPHAVLVCGSDG